MLRYIVISLALGVYLGTGAAVASSLNANIVPAFESFDTEFATLSFTGQLYKDTGTPLAPPQLHLVSEGDTLTELALANGLSLNYLAKINQLSKPYKLRIGQPLLLAAWGEDAASGSLLQQLLYYFQVNVDQRFSHAVVDANDNLYRIGQMHLTSMSKLGQKNNLNSNYTIHPQQSLVLPEVDYWTVCLAELPWQQDYLFYLAKDGQSVLDIAQELGVEEYRLQVIAPRIVWVFQEFSDEPVAVVSTVEAVEIVEIVEVVGIVEAIELVEAVSTIETFEVFKAVGIVEVIEPVEAVTAIEAVEGVERVKIAEALQVLPVQPESEPTEPELESVHEEVPVVETQIKAQETIVELTPDIELLITDLVFSESSQLAPKDLNKAKSLSVGQKLDMTSLQPALDLLNERYQELGYKLSQALVKQQQVVDGIIHIELIEAKVGRVFLQQGSGMSESYVAKYLGMRAGDNIQVNKLDSRLKRYNRYHSGQARVAMQAGENYGESDIAVSIISPRNITGALSLNNYGSEATGREQHVWTVDIWNLSGVDDQFTASAQNSRGVESVSGIYNRNVGSQGASVSLSGATSSSNIIGGPLAAIGVSGRSYSGAMDFLYPVYMGENLYVDGSFDFSSQYSETKYSGGATSQNSRVKKYSLGYKFEYVGENTVWTYFPKYQVYELKDLDTLGATSNSVGHKFVSNFNLQHMLTNTVSLGLTNSLQYSVEKDISTLEQFSIGGLGSVRSYGSSSHAGSSGTYFGAQLETPLGAMLDLKPGNLIANVQAYTFYDWAVAVPFRAGAQKRLKEDYFSGYGFGLKLLVPDKGVGFDIFVGKPDNASMHSDVIEKDKPLVLGQLKASF